MATRPISELIGAPGGMAAFDHNHAAAYAGIGHNHDGTYAFAAHEHAILDVTGLQGALDLKAPLASPALSGAPTAPTAAGATNNTQLATTAFVHSLIAAVTGGASAAYDTLFELQGLMEADDTAFSALTTVVGGKLQKDQNLSDLTDPSVARTNLVLGNVNNTSDVNKPVSTATQTALDNKAPLASPALTGNPTAPTPAAGDSDTSIATSAYAVAAAPNASYRVLLDSSGSHIAARVAGLYGLAQSQPLAISGTGTLYPLNLIYIDPADFPTVNGLTTKLRCRMVLAANDVPPTGNYTLALHPVTRPATSGGAGLCIYTIGAAVAGSGVTRNTPAADSMTNDVGTDFAIPAAGFYVLAVTTTATVAASSLVHISASLQMRNT